MKVLKELERTECYNNIYFNVYVTVSATNYYITVKRIGWALPASDNWKYPKKQYTLEQAILKHLEEVCERWDWHK